MDYHHAVFYLKIMNDKDKNLIEQAKKLDFVNYSLADYLEKEASSEEAKREIRRIRVRLYRIEERKTERYE